MSSKIYGKLAITNLKNNRKTYVPYILMAVLSVMMYYIVGGMAKSKCENDYGLYEWTADDLFCNFSILYEQFPD